MPDIPASFWIGVDEAGGIPNPGRPDVTEPAHWRLDAIAATERPRQLDVASDGRTIAFVLDRDTSDVWTIDAFEPASPVRITTGRTLAAYWDDGGVVWSPNRERLAFVTGGAVHVVAAAGGPPRSLCDGSSPVWLDDDRLVIAVDRGPRQVSTTALAVIAVDDPWPSRLAVGDGDRADARVSPDRSAIASTLLHRYDLNCTSLHVTDVASATDRVVAVTTGRNVRAPAWSPEGARLAFADENPGWYEIHLVPADGSAAPTRLTDADADFSELSWSDDGTVILAVRSRHGVSDLTLVDASSGRVDVVAPGGTWSSPRWLGDGSIVAVHESHDAAPRICRITAADDRWKVEPLFAPTPAAVRAAPHVRPDHVTYPSFDGLEVHGWLYVPPHASAERPAPMVVHPHGGPTSVTGDEWDGIAQYFVDKGYGWFSLNVRGSTTFGRDFERANHHAWGVLDTQDCLAAHDHLATLPWVDPARVAIFGASYGSYLALASLVDDPEHRYACGVAKYGDCDIVTSWAQGDLVGRLDIERMMGRPGDQREAYHAGSPIHRIDQLVAPVLVAHGDHDDRVHPKQSVELVDALRRLGKTYEYVTYTTEAHGFLRTGPFMDFYTRMARFLDWYLR